MSEASASNGSAKIYTGEKFFVRGDKIPIMAALIDSTILGIGILVGVLWQSTLSNKPVHDASPTWVVAGKNVLASSKAPPTSVATKVSTTTVCSAFVTTAFKDGRTHAVEYRGKCSTLHSLLAGSKLPLHWSAPRTYTYVTNGG